MLFNGVAVGRVPIIDLNVTPLDPTRIAHAQSKRSEARFRFRISFGNTDQHAHAWHSIALLGLDRQWPNSRRASNNLDEIPPAHATLHPWPDDIF
jgi:hypothetical protein